VGIFDRRTREERFWDWFRANSDRLFALEDDRERVFADLRKALHKVDGGLTFEFTCVADGSRQFCVSADGVREQFPVVRQLVAAAPVMAQWDIVAFRQPSDPTCSITFGDQELSPDDLWFVLKPDEGIVHIDFYVRGLSDENSDLMTGAVFVLLDNALGEELVGEAVGEIDFEPLLEDPQLAGLSPFPELPDEVRRVVEQEHG